MCILYFALWYVIVYMRLLKNSTNVETHCMYKESDIGERKYVVSVAQRKWRGAPCPFLHRYHAEKYTVSILLISTKYCPFVTLKLFQFWYSANLIVWRTQRTLSIFARNLVVIYRNLIKITHFSRKLLKPNIVPFFHELK